jgi:signal transduction histidine kinase
MQSILTLLDTSQLVIWPAQIIGWAGWFVMLALIVWGMRYWWEPLEGINVKKAIIVVGLSAAALVFTLFIGIRFSPNQAIAIPGTVVDPKPPVVMLFTAVPWVFAAGMLGPLYAVLFGAFSGLVLAFFEVHNLFTPLALGLTALLYSVIVRQPYRTGVFQLLRHPLAASVLMGLVVTPLLMLGAILSIDDTLAVRLDFALTDIWMQILARWIEVLIAGALAEVIYISGVKVWERPKEMRPSPIETSLQFRFLSGALPLIFGLIIFLTIGDWIVAGKAARKMIKSQLTSTATVAAESLPFFLETGQSMIVSMADESLFSLSNGGRSFELGQQMRVIPFFHQLVLMDGNRQIIAAYPEVPFEQINLTEDELSGVEIALRGFHVQYLPIASSSEKNAAQISFIASINDNNGITQGVLIGRTDLYSNPFTQSAIQAFQSVEDEGGEGAILEENGIVLYHTNPTLVMTQYLGIETDQAEFNQGASASAGGSWMYIQPVVGTGWTVLVSLPTEKSNQMALEIAIPLLLILLALSAASITLLHLGLRWVTNSLTNVADEAALIAQGQLNHPLIIDGVDEIGRLRQAFERMRISLKARLDELNHLLLVSQGVAANLDVKNAVQPILRAALSEGACMARIVLLKEDSLGVNDQEYTAFGIGPKADIFSYLDEHIIELMRNYDQLPIPNFHRSQLISTPMGSPMPGGLAALAVRLEKRYYGVLWVAYERPHVLTNEEIRFLNTLASEAALAASNSRLYNTAEEGRQRLEAVIASTPEPVLVFDRDMRLLLLNQASLQVTNLVDVTIPGSPIEEVIVNKVLLTLCLQEGNQNEKESSSEQGLMSSREIKLDNKRIFYATVSPVLADGIPVGKICMLRDITHYKELDTLKSDFVETVSHDLRSPLTLVRGYASMLPMVGEINEQQTSYVSKIISGVEDMSRLVNNLLDLGRVEAGIGLRIEKTSVSNTISEVIESLQLQLDHKKIQLQCIGLAQDEALMIEADPALLRQAIYNLVENAVKYSQLGGGIRLAVRHNADTVLFTVQDNGIGIAPLDLPHMFEKFYRSGRREAYRQRGAGLGLAIVKSIAERHNGKVWVDSQLGKGSKFHFQIPRVNPESN